MPSSADYHTSGVTVCNGWKVRNIAKNKWFVLVARTATEKQQWIEAFRVQKDRIKSVCIHWCVAQCMILYIIQEWQQD